MATAYEVIHKSVHGNQRVHIVSCSVDAASANIDTGLSVIHGFSVGVVSMTTTSASFKKNLGSAATARPGILNVNSTVSGDVFLLTVFGV